MEESSEYELCDVCDQPAYNICSECNMSIYCSEQCQLQDWEYHQDICYIGDTVEDDSEDEYEYESYSDEDEYLGEELMFIDAFGRPRKKKIRKKKIRKKRRKTRRQIDRAERKKDRIR